MRKKSIIYSVIALVIVAVIVMLFTGDNKKPKKMDQRITLRRTDKIPYGGFIAYENLHHLFPNAGIVASKSSPGYWDSTSKYNNSEAVLIISPRFHADAFEMRNLLKFMQNGNSVFISTLDISTAALDLLGKLTVYNDRGQLISRNSVTNDSMEIKLSAPPFDETESFYFNGAKYKGWFDRLDSNYADILGTDHRNRANFIHLKAGKGDLYIHLFPLAFSNYFLLQQDNLAYYENVLSMIPPDTKRIIWDEYYIDKDDMSSSPRSGGSGSGSGSNSSYERENRGFIGELMTYSQFKAAFLVAVLTLLLFLLLEMRRKQRHIPAFSRPRNESLDFVKTVGRLYYDKGNHKNLCHKMAAYFLEYVRNKYKLQTSLLDEDFVNKLRFKTGAEEFEIREIVSFIKYIDEMPDTVKVTDSQLVNFHKQLESFYKKA